MAVIEILQKIREESERLLAQLDSGSSRFYEITTAGTIVEQTHQLRGFYQSIVQQLGHAIHVLDAGGTQRRE
jgi:hypothetical protein